MNHPNDCTKTDSLNTRNFFPICRRQSGRSLFHSTSRLMLGAALGACGLCASANLRAADAAAPASTAPAATSASAATTAAPADTSAPAASAASTASAAAPAASSAATGSASARGRRGATTGARAAGTGAAPAAPSAPPAAWDRPADGPAIFTEDFESGVLNDKTWTLHVVGKPTVTIAQDNVAHGKNALHIHYPAGTTTKEWAFAGIPVPEALRDHFYGRAYVFISNPPVGHCVLMLAGSTGFPIADFLEIGDRQNQFQPSFQLNQPTPDRLRNEKTYLMGTPPIGRWFCLEWEFNDKPDRIVMWVDGKLSVNQPIAMPVVKGDPATSSGLVRGFFEFNLGYRSWSVPTKDMDIYYDDIAIGDKPIGQLTPVAAKPAATDAKPATTDAKPTTTADTQSAASTPSPAKATN